MDPLYSKSCNGEIENPLLLHPEVKINPKITKFAYEKILQQFQELPDEPDMNAEQIDIISKALDSFILPMSRNSAFYDTDLIVINESFQGTLPLNGIKQSQLDLIENIFTSICDGKEKFQILIKETGDPFKTDVEEMIKKLLTRNIGRKLIQAVLRNDDLQKIEIACGKECVVNEVADGIMHISLGGESYRFFAHHPSGQLKTQADPLFLGLAHELIHLLHHPNLDDASPPTFSDKYTDLEEQWTITGLKQDPFLDENKENDESWEPSENFILALKESYDGLNDWNLSAAFTNSQHVYYPRFGHKSIDLNPLRLKKHEIKHLKSIGKYEETLQKVQRSILISLVLNGALYDLKNLINVDLHQIFENVRCPAIFLGALSGKVNVLQFLVDQGFNLHETASGTNALGCLFCNVETEHLMEYYDIVEFLLKNQIDVGTAFIALISNADLHLLNTEKFRPLTQLIFNYYAKTYNLSQFFLHYSSDHLIDSDVLGNLISQSASANFENFLKKTQTLDALKTEYDYYAELSDVLAFSGIDTSALDKTLDSLHQTLNKFEELGDVPGGKKQAGKGADPK